MWKKTLLRGIVLAHPTFTRHGLLYSWWYMCLFQWLQYYRVHGLKEGTVASRAVHIGHIMKFHLAQDPCGVSFCSMWPGLQQFWAEIVVFHVIFESHVAVHALTFSQVSLLLGENFQMETPRTCVQDRRVYCVMPNGSHSEHYIWHTPCHTTPQNVQQRIQQSLGIITM